MVGPPLVCGGCRGEAGPYPVGMSVAERLREARLAAGLTQAQLAQRIGVADGTRVAAWEHGRSTPHPATATPTATKTPMPIATDTRHET